MSDQNRLQMTNEVDRPKTSKKNTCSSKLLVHFDYFALTTSIICWSVTPKVNINGWDSFKTGLQAFFDNFVCCKRYHSFSFQLIKVIACSVFHILVVILWAVLSRKAHHWNLVNPIVWPSRQTIKYYTPDLCITIQKNIQIWYHPHRYSCITIQTNNQIIPPRQIFIHYHPEKYSSITIQTD